MKTFYGALILTVFSWLQMTSGVLAADVNGLWFKTTSADPNNITIFYHENGALQAIGYSTLQDRKILWYATGEIKEFRMRLSYHYNVNAMPPGWEPDGKMDLSIADDGNTIAGAATAASGSWSGKIEFKRIQIVSPQLE